MFASLATVSTVFLAAASLVSAHPMAHSELARRHTLETRGKPAGWPDKLLENYDVYHTRYNALSCQDKHGDKTFFNKCCTPMLAGQKLSSRPAECTPKASNDDGEVDDCDDDDSPPPSKPTSSSAKPTSAKPTSKPTSPAKPPVKASDDGGDFNFTGGKATFFFQHGVAGACGKPNSDSTPLVALDFRRYGNMGRKSPDCGRHVLIKNTKNGKTVKAFVADACPSCENPNSLDLSTGAFNAIGNPDDGVLPIAWKFVD